MKIKYGGEWEGATPPPKEVVIHDGIFFFWNFGGVGE